MGPAVREEALEEEGGLRLVCLLMGGVEPGVSRGAPRRLTWRPKEARVAKLRRPRTACSTAFSERYPSARALRIRRNDAWLTLRPRLLVGSSGSMTFINLGANGLGSGARPDEEAPDVLGALTV